MTDKDTAGLHPAALWAIEEADRIIRSLAALLAPKIGMDAIAVQFRHWQNEEPGTADLEAERIDAEAANMTPPTLCGHCFVLATAYAAQATAAALTDDGLEAWRQISEANLWHGTARGLFFAGVEINRAQMDAMRAVGASGGLGKKLKDSDGKQAAKRKVKADFWAWTEAKKGENLSDWKDPRGREIRSGAAFANEMLRRFPTLASTATITDKWIPAWLAEGPPARRVQGK